MRLDFGAKGDIGQNGMRFYPFGKFEHALPNERAVPGTRDRRQAIAFGAQFLPKLGLCHGKREKGNGKWEINVSFPLSLYPFPANRRAASSCLLHNPNRPV